MGGWSGGGGSLTLVRETKLGKGEGGGLNPGWRDRGEHCLPEGGVRRVGWRRGGEG